MDSEVNSGGSEVSNGANGASEVSEVSEVSADSCQQGSATVEVDAAETARPSRVDTILQSKTFRDELERLVSSGLLEEGQSVTGCLEQLTTMISMARGGARSQQSAKGYHCVQPVYDLRGAEASHFSAHERTMRCRLACLFRMVDALGWSDDSCSHFVVLLEDSDNSNSNNSSSNLPCSVLVNPTDLLYSQLSASTLLSVPLDQLLPAAAAAQEQQQQHTRGSCAAAAAVDSRQLQQLHAPLLAAGSRCVLHVRHLAVAAVSALRCGLLPLTEYACALGPVEHLSGYEQLVEWYHHHHQHQQQQQQEEGAGGSPDAAPRSSSSSSGCGVVLVRHHGAVCVADSPEQAFFLLVNLVAACETQLKMMPLGVDNLVLMSETDQKRCYEEWHTVLTPTSPLPTGAQTGAAGADSCLWRAQFDTGLRLLERTGCRTGHMVQLPLLSAAAAAKAAGGGGGDGCDLTTAADLSHALASPNRKMSAVSRTGERNRWLSQQQQQQQQRAVVCATARPSAQYSLTCGEPICAANRTRPNCGGGGCPPVGGVRVLPLCSGGGVGGGGGGVGRASTLPVDSCSSTVRPPSDDNDSSSSSSAGGAGGDDGGAGGDGGGAGGDGGGAGGDGDGVILSATMPADQSSRKQLSESRKRNNSSFRRFALLLFRNKKKRKSKRNEQK